MDRDFGYWDIRKRVLKHLSNTRFFDYTEDAVDNKVYMSNLPDQLIARMRNLGISEDELHEKFSRSGGPGGQNVNKVSSRVQISYAHPEFGIFNVSCQKERDREKNRIAARERLCERIENFLEGRSLVDAQSRHQDRVRKRKPSVKAREKKKQDKIHQSKKKANRRFGSED